MHETSDILSLPEEQKQPYNLCTLQPTKEQQEIIKELIAQEIDADKEAILAVLYATYDEYQGFFDQQFSPVPETITKIFQIEGRNKNTIAKALSTEEIILLMKLSRENRYLPKEQKLASDKSKADNKEENLQEEEEITLKQIEDQIDLIQENGLRLVMAMITCMKQLI